MNKERKAQFFNMRPNLTTVKMGGKKLALANFSPEEKKVVMYRIAERDPVMMEGLKGVLPGLLIDGKQVTRDNIKDFELKSKTAKEVVKEEVEEVVEKVVEEIVEKEVESVGEKYTKKELEKLGFKELKVIGRKINTTDRSKKGLIEEILELQ